MIKQEFIINTKPWKVYVYYDFVLDDIDEVISTLEDINFPEHYITSAYTILKQTTVNCGFTYTHLENKTTLIVITKTTSPGQFINSLVHEIFHLVNHISKVYNIDNDSEEPCYLAGDIAQQTLNVCHKLLCKHCRNT